jgi:hypothetical protein
LTLGRDNPWIADAEDPPFDEESFHACENIEELQAKLDQGNQCLGQAYYLGDICLINQVNSGDEWLVIKQDCAFDSFTVGPMIADSLHPFRRVIEDIQHATVDECKNLRYRFKPHEVTAEQLIAAVKAKLYDFECLGTDKKKTSRLAFLADPERDQDGVGAQNFEEACREYHAAMVTIAFARGRWIPNNVLAQYPELQAMHERKKQQAT